MYASFFLFISILNLNQRDATKGTEVLVNAQVLAKKLLTPDMPGDAVEEPFFSDLFSLFVKMNLIKKFKEGFYLNPEKIVVDDVEQTLKMGKESMVCSKCAEVYNPGVFVGIDKNGLPCLIYNCKGNLVLQNEALDHYHRSRRHRIAVNSTYCGSSTHDTLFFDTPEEMNKGEIKTPTFSMRNYPLLQKHAHPTD